MQNKNVKHLEKIKDIIGIDKFQALVEVLPGAAIRLPNNAIHFNKMKRNGQIRIDYEAGIDVPDLANKYHLSESQIYKITEKI